jgi:CubicO group peptidase (beta-lactamase class C family)
MPYETYLYQHLWKPAGMTSTGYQRPAFAPDVIATGYDGDGKAWGKPNAKPWDRGGPFWHLKGNGGILSTVGDLARWHHALLGNSILSPASKAKYYAPPLRSDETRDSYYAYGWDVHRTPRGTQVIEHNGANGIFYADFRRFVDEGVVVIVMMNDAPPTFQNVVGDIVRVVFEPAYVPPMPSASNTQNRRFTDSMIVIARASGAGPAWETYGRRAPGTDLIESRVNEQGYELLQEKDFPHAIEVFRLNTLVFPRSGNAFDSLGEAYMAAGMNDRAIESYRKSLELDPGNTNAVEVLKTLTGK